MNSSSSPLKLHLRIVELPRYTYRVITLRSSCGVRFSNNVFHNTWHILTDPSGAAILSRLLWGLAFQRKPGTLVLIGDQHLVPTPFESDRSAPCIFSRVGLTRVDRDLLSGLRSRLNRLGVPTTTVKWQTFGMAAASQAMDHSRIYNAEWEPLWNQERMDKREGFICYSAPPEIMRCQAISIMKMQSGPYRGMSYHYLAGGRRGVRHPEGEVQIFADFDDRVSSARLARNRTLSNPKRFIGSEEERRTTWAETEAILATRIRERRRRHGEIAPADPR